MKTVALKIKNINETDSPLIKELARRCPPLDLHTSYTYWVVAKMFGKYSFIVLEDDEPIGYIMCVKNQTCLLIWQIGILEEYRQKNISQILIDKVFSTLETDEFVPVIVSIAAENKNSYFAFLKYCEYNGYIMKEKSNVCLKDIYDPSFYENEILYEINKE